MALMGANQLIKPLLAVLGPEYHADLWLAVVALQVDLLKMLMFLC